MREWILFGAGLIAAAAITAVTSTTPAAAGRIDLTVAGRVSATPSIAAVDRFVVVTWGGTTAEGLTDVYSAVSRDGAQTFGTPVRVNDVTGDAKLNGEQPPHVVLVPRTRQDPVLTIVWTSKRASGTALLRSQSTDGGRSFTPAQVVPGTAAPGNRGWEAIASDGADRIQVVWLDHRELAQPGAAVTSQADHAAHEGSGADAAQRSKLYFASLGGRDPARAITGGVCYCCKTAIAVGQRGAVYLAWRHVFPGDVRDIAFAASRDGGKTFSAPQRVSQDGWAINGCPENGPTMAVDAKGAIHIAWPTLVPGPQPALGLFYASSSDGQAFTPRKRIPTSGTPSHAQLALDASGGLLLVWDELKDGARQIMFSRRPASAAEFGAAATLTSSTRGSYPVVAATRSGVVIAWTGGAADASTIHVQRIDQ